jgi:glutamate---cysteine ligase / carboxylate-amine ligase
MTSHDHATTAGRLCAAFDADAPLTVGVEEELMLLDPRTLDLAPRAHEVLAQLKDDPRFKAELPAAQLELLTMPCSTVGEAEAALADGRAALARAAAGIGLPAGAGAHPFAAPEGVLVKTARYRQMRKEYGPMARRQLVFGLHVHVRVSGAARALAVYNALRSLLPELAALAANAPFHAGRDTGLASIRPKISETLPRQGIPPALSSLDELAAALDWGAAAGVMPSPRTWWWELRLHPELATVEVRVPDQQTTAGESAALAGVVHALVARLAARHDAGEPLEVHPSWRIAENRWSAARHGLDGWMADLHTGERRPTRARLHALLDELAPMADRVSAARQLAAARKLVEANGAVRQRAAAADGDLRPVVAALSERFLA